MNPADLTTVNDIAKRAGVTRLTARTWTHRYPDFPAPWKIGGPGEPHLYLWADIEAWLEATGRLTTSSHVPPPLE